MRYITRLDHKRRKEKEEHKQANNSMMMDGSNESGDDNTREHREGNHDHDYADRSKNSNGNNGETTTTGGGGGRGGGLLALLKAQQTQISDLQFPLTLILVSSCILLIAVTSVEGDFPSRGYALSVPSLSLCLSLSGFLVAQFREDLYQVYGKYLAHLLFTWNFIGASFLTFNAPFTTTGNGYFAAWATVAVSAMAMGFTAEAFKDQVKGVGSLMGLCACSVILIFSVLEHVWASNESALTQNASIYAFSISILTIVWIMGILFCKQKEVGGRMDHIVINGQMRFNTTAESRTDTVENKVTTMDMLKLGVLCIMTVLWFLVACLVTFRGPFTTTGNGYFSAWAGCACISFATYNAKKEISNTKKKMNMELMNQTIDDDDEENGNGVEGMTGLSANNV
mmetsp:Transcript_37988/g.42820  ORF Transcript_37988/g.42820 Transcript_37988/m.42820 type:complete len:397 (+) Transcript_37988:44-1234(+)